MGVCACIPQDNTSKYVDVENLKNDESNNNINKGYSTSTKMKDKIKEEVPPKQIIEDNHDDDSMSKPVIQHKNTESSNRSEKKKKSTIIIEPEEQPIANSNNQSNLPINNIIITQQSLLSCQKKSEIIDSRIICSQRAISKFLNRNYINIVILGRKGVGKSAFVIKFIENVFEKHYIPTLGVEIRRKKFSYNTHNYDLNFTVTSGNDYKADYSKAYESVDFFLVFYDTTSMDSFDEAKIILKSEVKSYLYSYGQAMTNVFLVGNKVDELPRKVPEDLCKKFCDKNNFQLFDISVKTNKNITTMMKALIKTVDDIAYPN